MAEETVINLPNHKKGNTFPGHNFFAKNPDESAYNLLDCEIKAAFKFGSPDGTIQETFSISSGFTIIDESAGHFFLDKQVIDWPVGKYFYDIQITKADAEIDTPVKGTWTITQDITQTS